MKKTILIISALLALSLLFAGCYRTNTDDETAKLQQQISELQSQLDAMQNGSTNPADATEPSGNTAQSPTENTTAATTKGTTAAQAIKTTNSLQELTDMVTAYEKSASDAAKNPSNSFDKFFTLKQQNDKIERAIDIHENEIESYVYSGALSRAEYNQRERALDELENRLDKAEDSLEYAFGIYD